MPAESLWTIPELDPDSQPELSGDSPASILQTQAEIIRDATGDRLIGEVFVYELEADPETGVSPDFETVASLALRPHGRAGWRVTIVEAFYDEPGLYPCELRLGGEDATRRCADAEAFRRELKELLSGSWTQESLRKLLQRS